MPWKRDDYSIKELGMLAERLGHATASEQNSPSRTHGRRWLVAVPTAVAAAVIFLLAVGAFRGDPTGALSLDEAVAAVQKVAFDQPVVDPDEVLYVKKRTMNTAGGFQRRSREYAATETATEERWYRPGDKKGWIRFTIDPLTFPTEQDRIAHDRIEGRVPTVPRILTCKSVTAARQEFGNLESILMLPKGTELPDNSRAVYALLDRSIPNGYIGPGGHPEVIWQMIAYAMRGGAPDVKPAQRAQLVGALAEIPGVATLGRTIDPLGNSSIGFERNFGNARSRLYFDAKTSLTTYMDRSARTRQKVGFNEVPAGTTLWSTALLEHRYIEGYPKLASSTPREVGRLIILCPELRHQKPRK